MLTDTNVSVLFAFFSVLRLHRNSFNSFIGNVIYTGYNFALLSGTSMAAPHVAGIAAPIKQHNPSWTPSMMASAITTTTRKYDNLGDPLMTEGYEVNTLHPSTPFEHGAGIVDPSRANNPGLVLSSGIYVATSNRKFTA